MSGKRVLFDGHNTIFARALKVPEALERDNVSGVGIATKNDSTKENGSPFLSPRAS
jgi:hypothetical protein